MSTASIKETLLQEVGTLSPAYYSEALRLIESLKAGKIRVADDFVGTMEEFEDYNDFEDIPPIPNRKVQFDCMKGEIWMADDFDAPLEEFKEYM